MRTTVVPASTFTGDHRTGAVGRLGPDAYALQDGGVRADEHPFAEVDLSAPGMMTASASATIGLERELVTVEAVLERIEEQGQPGTAGAVLSGVLDAWAGLRAADLQQAIDAALASTLASVRCRALDVLALTGRLEGAKSLVPDDGAAKVRAWQPPAQLTPPAQLSLLDTDD